MKFNHYIAFTLSALYAFGAANVMAGAFIGASENNPDIVLHPSGYSPGNQNLQVNVCISPSSDVTTELVIPLQNVIDTYNALQATTGNLGLGGNNNIPSGQLDAESVLLHEVGHCVGLSHVNLASESGLPTADWEYTKSTTGGDGSFDLDDGADNIKGSSDDLRDDDTNLHYFKRVDNNPFTLAGTIDSSTYSRNLADLPAGTYAANASRDLAPQLGVTGTEAVMQQGQFFDEAQRSLAADDVATILYGASGVDETAGTNDDYALTLVYQGVTSSNCDITVVVDNNTGFAQCEVSFQGVSGSHFRIAGATVRLNQFTNWFYNQVPVAPINMAPSLDSIGDELTNEEDFIVIPVSGSDPDAGDALTLSSNAPPFCFLADADNGTGTLDCAPVAGDAGEYPITVTLTDDGDPVLSTSQSFVLTVLPEGVGLVSQCNTPFAEIPDNTGVSLVDSITFSDARQIVDIDVTVIVSHTFVGDVSASVTRVNSGTSAVLVDRAGVPASTNGCSGDDISAMFDDEGTDGAAEDVCNPTPPALGGRLTPADPLSGFDSESIDGEWQITMTDSVNEDSGMLFQWCIDATVVVAPEIDTDADGVFDSIDNCTLVANSGQEDTNGDGFGNACDGDYDDNCIVNFADVSAFVPGFNSATGDPNYNPDFDANSDGSIAFLDFFMLTGSFLMEPGPGANECVPIDN